MKLFGRKNKKAEQKLKEESPQTQDESRAAIINGAAVEQTTTLDVEPTVSESAKDSTVEETISDNITEKPRQTAPPVPEKKSGLFSRLKQGLNRTRESFTESVADLMLGEKEIDDDLLEELETQLIIADVGIDAAQHIVENLTKRVKRKEVAKVSALWSALQQELSDILKPCEIPLTIETSHQPYVILMVGINGSGKTTTIGKLTKRLQQQGKKVMLAAGDTFRAAAIEQLTEWGDRNNVPVISQHHGADSASVIFDALEAAKARQYDVLIADTAGRLHTQTNLMEELKKVKRVMSKIDATAPHEVMLVLDAGIGQNALVQAEQFNAAVGVTGITITKLDGTAKGGILFAIAKKLGIPLRFIGVGEQIDDLRPFDATEFTEALLQHPSRNQQQEVSS